MGTPEVLGPYVIYERLGAGGMATVHRAEQIGLAGFRKQVALKRLLPHIASDPKMVKMFTHEARLASHLRHGNVAQIYELGKHDDTYFIAMEYVAGPSITQIMKQCGTASGAMPVSIVLSILGQVCEALDHAHNLCDDSGTPLGIIHRDVSPGNLIVSSSGEVKLIDFGIAKVADAGDVQTQAGFIKGKYAYIAPEYTLGHLDLRADLFGLGVIAHELLTTRRLFNASSDFETIKRLREMPIQPPSRWNPQVPPDVDDIVMTALQRDPSLRWQSALAMRTAIHNAARSTDNIATNQQLAEWIEWCFGKKPIQETTSLGRAIDTLGDSTSGTSELDTNQRIELEVLGAIADISQATIPDDDDEVEPPTPAVQERPATKSMRPGPRSKPQPAMDDFDTEPPTRAYDGDVPSRAFEAEPPTRVVSPAYVEPASRETPNPRTPRTSAHVIHRGTKEEKAPPPPIKPYNARTAAGAAKLSTPAAFAQTPMIESIGGPNAPAPNAPNAPASKSPLGAPNAPTSKSPLGGPNAPSKTLPNASPPSPKLGPNAMPLGGPRDVTTGSPTAPRLVPISLPLGGPTPSGVVHDSLPLGGPTSPTASVPTVPASPVARSSGLVPNQPGPADRQTVVERIEPVMPERAKRASQMPQNAIAIILPPEQRAVAQLAEDEHEERMAAKRVEEANRSAEAARAVKALATFPVDEDSGVVVSAAPPVKRKRRVWPWIVLAVVLLAAGACAYLYFVEGLVPDF